MLHKGKIPGCSIKLTIEFPTTRTPNYTKMPSNNDQGEWTESILSTLSTNFVTFEDRITKLTWLFCSFYLTNQLIEQANECSLHGNIMHDQCLNSKVTCPLDSSTKISWCDCSIHHPYTITGFTQIYRALISVGQLDSRKFLGLLIVPSCSRHTGILIEEPMHMANDTLMEVVRSRVAERRRNPQIDNAELMFDPQKVEKCIWGPEGSGKKLTPSILTKMVAKKEECEHSYPRRDTLYMDEFLNHSKREGAFRAFPESEPIDSVWPAGAPIIDFVTHQAAVDDTWTKPGVSLDLLKLMQARGLTSDIVSELKITEIIVGETPAEDIEAAAIDIQEMMEEQNKYCALEFISLESEVLPISPEDYTAIIDQESEEPISLKDVNAKGKGESWHQLPVKLLFGNGITHLFVVTMKTDYDVKKRALSIKPLRFQPELIDLLTKLPTPVGLGIRKDVMEYEALVKKCTGENEFKIGDTFLDISALAVGAGWNLGTFDMSVLSYQLLGAVLNRQVSSADYMWGLPWKKLSNSMKVYAIGDIAFSNFATTTLFYYMLMNMFPDPDVVLAMTRSDRHEFPQFFGKLVKSTFVGLEVQGEALKKARNMKEVLYSLRYRVLPSTKEESSRLSDGPPDRIKLFRRLVGSWPSIPNGGARYLHQVRHHFSFRQHRELSAAGVQDWEPLFYTLNEECMEQTLYGHPNIASTYHYNYKDGTGIAEPVLTVHSNLLPETLVKIRLDKLTSQKIEAVAKGNEGIRRELFCESVRLGFRHFNQFLQVVEKDEHFMRWIRSYYVEGRNIVYRATGRWPGRLKEVDKFLEDKSLKAVQFEQEQIQKLQKELEERKIRVEHYKQEAIRAVSDGLIPPSTITHRGQIPAAGKKKRGRKGCQMDENPLTLRYELRDYLSTEFGEDPVHFTNPDEFESLGRFKVGSSSQTSPVEIRTVRWRTDEEIETATRDSLRTEDWELDSQ